MFGPVEETLVKMFALNLVVYASRWTTSASRFRRLHDHPNG